MERWRIQLAIVGLAGVMDTAFLLGLIAGYAKSLGAGDEYAGLIAGLYSMVALPASLAAGIIVDKVGRRRSLAIGLAWDTASMIGYALASTPAQLAAVRGLHAVGGSLVYPAYMAIVGDTAPRGRLGSSTGRYLSVVAAAVALGSLSSAAAVSRLGFKQSFLLIALILLIGLLSTQGLPETRGQGGGVARGLARARGLVASAGILIFLLYTGFGAIIGGMPQALLNDGIASSEEEASALTGAAIGVATLASIPLFPLAGGRLDRGSLQHVVTVSSALGVAGLWIASSSMTTHILAGFTLYGATIAGLMTASTYLAAQAPREARGTSMAIQQVANIAGVAVGAPLGGVASTQGLIGIASLVALSLLAAAAYTLILPRATSPRG